MELAIRSSASCEGSVRVKLCFEDRSILSPNQLDDGLLASWFVVRPHVHTIADLAADIVLTFNLSKSCPYGVLLRMENFALPSSQPIWLLKDKDVVSVNRKIGPNNSAKKALQLANSSSLADSDAGDGNQPLGVKPCAIEEFEKETGGYESEEEEDAAEAPHDDLDSLDKGFKSKSASKQQRRKKRKRDALEGTNEMEKSTKLQLVPYTGQDIMKEMTPKRESAVLHPSSKKKKLLSGGKSHKSQKDEKVEESKRPKLTDAAAETKRRKIAVESTCSDASDAVNPDQVNVDNISEKQCATRPPASNHQEQVDSKAADVKKKLSRSTLRKKAKRRWKREHQEAMATETNEKKDTNTRSNEKSKSKFFSVLKTNDDDGEAEEEKLPIVVRPGHIRFEPLDEDDGDYNAEHAMPTFAWSEGVSKRKGQSWGQEKPHTNKNDRKLKGSGSSGNNEFHNISFHDLPALTVAPQVGDMLAYRLLELTPSKCPEVSEYRVGKVDSVESQSGMLKLVEVPQYPLHKCWEDETERNMDTTISCPYNEDGSLEIQWTSLLDVRLVEGVSKDIKKDGSGCQASDIVAREHNHVSSSAEGLPDVSTSAMDGGGLCTSHKGVTANSQPSRPCSETKDQDKVNGSGDLMTTWQEIAEVLDKKKEELSKCGHMVSTEECSVNPNFVETSQGNGDSGAEKGSRKKNNSRKSWFRRTGGLGSTMALLRAQNAM